MNRDELLKRIAMVSAEMEQMKSNYVKLEGHLDEAKHWLAQLDAPKEVAAEQPEQ